MTTESVALDIAHALIAAGIPVFAAAPWRDPAGSWDPAGGVGGYVLPHRWQHTLISPAAIDAWRPGWALGAVMGHTVDGLDADPRNGGADTRAQLIAAGAWPISYGSAVTPSGGSHELIRALGVASRDALRPGLDVKGGDIAGRGRGFLFIAPTIRLSKVTGELAAYRWDRPPSLRIPEDDDSGAAITEVIRAARRDDRSPQRASPPSARDLTPWVNGALRGESERVRGAAVGTRNTTLNTAAFRLGQLLVLPDDLIISALTAAYVGDDSPARVARTIRSGLNAGRNSPRTIVANGSTTVHQPTKKIRAAGCRPYRYGQRRWRPTYK